MIAPIEAVAVPFPIELQTPPVMKMKRACPAEIFERREVSPLRGDFRFFAAFLGLAIDERGNSACHVRGEGGFRAFLQRPPSILRGSSANARSKRRTPPEVLDRGEEVRSIFPCPTPSMVSGISCGNRYREASTGMNLGPWEMNSSSNGEWKSGEERGTTCVLHAGISSRGMF